MQVTIQEVNVQDVKNGRSQYSVAEVVYTSNGRNSKQKVFSFSNPAVFKILKDANFPVDANVTVTKNDKGYNEWQAVEIGGKDVAAPKQATVPQRSSYETPEERAMRQLMIVRQSSISNALTFLGEKEKTVDEVLQIAEEFVAWVYKTPDLFDQPNDLDA